jgi:tritrans,polycis-undecaprenyl-diphosphate synthase [geranylgeranyl-diphosphate specific]
MKNTNITLVYPINNNAENVINKIKKIINVYPNINIIIVDYGSTDDSIYNIYEFIKEYNMYNIKFIIKKDLKNSSIKYALNFINKDNTYIYNNILNKLELFDSKSTLKNQYNCYDFVINILYKLFLNNLPDIKINHIALILDGNRRYSKELNLNKKYQHIYGLFKTIELIEILKNKNIEYITLYAFSEENWKRGNDEITIIMSFLEILKNIYKSNKKFNKGLFKDIKLNILSTSFHRFDKETQSVLNEINNISNTETNKYTVNLFLSYGGQQEINNACKKAILDNPDLNDLDNFSINKYLLTKDFPPLDIMVRFGKVQRISNFLLYQLAYTELFFIDKYLPQIDKYDIEYIINSYKLRDRRLGK